MESLLYAALLSNLTLCAAEIYCLARLRKKRDIFRYYTFLQNFLALVASFLFCIMLARHLFSGAAMAEYPSGLRYMAGCGLSSAALIYFLFLSSNDKNTIKEADFTGLSPGRANFLLHIFCPALSLLSFVFFERALPLSSSFWTGLAALPSALYWAAYLILSAAGLWEEPYELSSGSSKAPKRLMEMLSFILLPALFILSSLVLWEIR